MSDASLGPAYRPDTVHRRLGERFYDPVEPGRFPDHVLRYRNDRAAAEVGLGELSDARWIDHFGRFEPLPDNLEQPLALRYHGHQFRHYNPDLGDGRGFLFAQLRDRVGRVLDLGTKGSGTTPYSRGGDGRLTLKGAVRELLATTLLEVRGVPTSRTFSIVETGESLWRNDEPSPTRSAVLVRLSHSHIRIGTFQRLAYEGDADAIARLVAHCGEHYGVGEGEPVGFLDDVATRVALMGAAWWAAGFVHGVLNTDNINVTGESFDYGPWRFMEAYDPGRTAAYFDTTGLYAFARQPEALSWNLARLAECLLVLDDGMRDGLVAILEAFPDRFERALIEGTHQRLRLTVPEPDDEEGTERVRAFYAAMAESSHPHERAFHDLMGGADRARIAASPHAETYATSPWREVIESLRRAPPSGPPSDAPGPVTMDHAEVEAIWVAIAEADDWKPLRDKLGAIWRSDAT